MSPTALAHSAPVPPFNANFYILAATVIPVLFLAVAVQGRFFKDLLDLAVRASRWVRNNPLPRESALLALTAVFSTIPELIIVSILYAGVGAEIIAIVALYQQRVGSSAATFVLAGVIFLAVTVIIPPTMAIIQTVAQAAREDRTQSQPRPAGNLGQPAPPQSQSPEPGETGTGDGT